jgi:hypothetical protein
MLTSKICREHAANYIETAQTILPSSKRQMFLDMAKSWTDLAAIIEGAEALLDPRSPPANDLDEPSLRLEREPTASLRPGSISPCELKRSNSRFDHSR